jgi:hypothetical protein
MEFQEGKTYKLPTGELVTLQHSEMGWYQIGNESKAWTVAPDGKVYDGLLTGGGTDPYRATGAHTGWISALITEA